MDNGETVQQLFGEAPSTTSGNLWGDDITLERKAELETRLRQWANEADHSEMQGPFSRDRGTAHLTGADVFWLAARALAGTTEEAAIATEQYVLRSAQRDASRRRALKIPDLHLEMADLTEAQLKHAVLAEAHFEGAILSQANLTGANLANAHLKGATLIAAHLEDAWLSQVDCSFAVLTSCNLQKAFLYSATFVHAIVDAANLSGSVWYGAHLRNASLAGVSCDGANLSYTDLSEASLTGSKFLGCDLSHANLSGANLCEARFDTNASLAEVVFDVRTRLADVSWSDIPLARVNWSAVPQLGDETHIKGSNEQGHFLSKSATSVTDSATAARAYRQLAVALRAQGMNEDADRYAYRAQLVQRAVLRLRRRYLPYLGSLFIDLLAGYGFRPERSLLVYLAVILWFANFYVWASYGLFGLGLPPTHVQPLAWYEGLILSVSSFHGRGFQPFQNLNDPIAALAGMQAVFGLIIEVGFIATFTQRFFAR